MDLPRSTEPRRPVERTLAQRVGYDAIRVLSRWFGVVVYGLRIVGRENWPPTGGGLVCANHQSFFDPVLVGLCCPRRMNALARDTLFRIPVLAPLIRFLDTIPLDREGTGLSGLKEALRRLKRGELVLIFPEGTRTKTGEIAPLKPGFVSLARRSHVPLIPVAFDGPYQAWPRSAWLPRPGRIAVFIGQPISADDVARLTDDELLGLLEQRLRDCHAQARHLRTRG